MKDIFSLATFTAGAFDERKPGHWLDENRENSRGRPKFAWHAASLPPWPCTAQPLSDEVIG